MNLIPHDGEGWLQGSTRFLSTSFRAIPWLSQAIIAFGDCLAVLIQRNRYVRTQRKTFHKVLQGLEQGDNDAQLCVRFCRRLHAYSNLQQRTLFADLFLAAYSMDSAATVGFFADQERILVSRFLLHYRA
jgi:hypothetical protein